MFIFCIKGKFHIPNVWANPSNKCMNILHCEEKPTAKHGRSEFAELCFTTVGNSRIYKFGFHCMSTLQMCQYRRLTIAIYVIRRG